MKSQMLWAEMARRKVQFHPNEDWRMLRLWGLFNWSDVSRYVKSGELVTDSRLTHLKEGKKVVWVWPSEEAYEKRIKPLIEKYSLDELTSMAWPEQVIRHFLIRSRNRMSCRPYSLLVSKLSWPEPKLTLSK